MQFEWYNATTNALITTTTEPQLDLDSIAPNQNGGVLSPISYQWL